MTDLAAEVRYALLGDRVGLSPVLRVSSIKGFEALPVTLFLTSDHSLKAMYAGVNGLATGAKHVAQLDEFRRSTEAILKQ